MKQIVLKKSLLLISFFLIEVLSFAQSNNDVVKQVQKLLIENYIFLDKAKETNGYLDKLMKKDFFTDKSPKEFAELFTQELQRITNDKHIRFSSFSPSTSTKNTKSTKNILMKNLSRYHSPMVRGVQMLESNVGYVDLAFFGGGKEHWQKIDAFMENMLAADAIIFDMRKNGGGNVETVNYLSSYFFEEKKLINTVYTRANNHTQELWVVDVNGKKRPKVPVYILTSKATFSGAEDFSYTMQSLGRATVIGEITGGGAHPTRGFPLGDGFMVGIPYARTINPVTKTNWEGVGVKPDIALSADMALEKAKGLALDEALVYRNSNFKALEDVLVSISGTEKKEDTGLAVLNQFDILIKSNMLTEGDINNLGYHFVENNQLDAALIVFESNAKLFPKSANTWDSCAEVHLKLNHKEKAIEYYKKAMSMDPEGFIGENAQVMLDKIKSN